jgi:hypothetical protein
MRQRPFNGRALIATLIGLGLMTLTGCPGMSVKDNQRFQERVARKVTPGMPLVTCTLDRQGLLPYVCIERVDLSTDAERRTVSLVNSQPIRCAGL